MAIKTIAKGCFSYRMAAQSIQADPILGKAKNTKVSINKNGVFGYHGPVTIQNANAVAESETRIQRKVFM
jgi:hypothetical protein